MCGRCCDSYSRNERYTQEEILDGRRAADTRNNRGEVPVFNLSNDPLPDLRPDQGQYFVGCPPRRVLPSQAQSY
jgi:hypothetical protein